MYVLKQKARNSWVFSSFVCNCVKVAATVFKIKDIGKIGTFNVIYAYFERGFIPVSVWFMLYFGISYDPIQLLRKVYNPYLVHFYLGAPHNYL